MTYQEYGHRGMWSISTTIVERSPDKEVPGTVDEDSEPPDSHNSSQRRHDVDDTIPSMEPQYEKDLIEETNDVEPDYLVLASSCHVTLIGSPTPSPQHMYVC
jgi:hypothetical protein